MPLENTKHRDILSAIESVGAIADLTAQHDGHYDYELDLEVIVYGRNYNGKKVGPYIRLLTYEPGEEIVREGDWGGNTLYIMVSGKADVLVRDNGKPTKVAEISQGLQFGEMSVLAGVPRAATVRAPIDRSVEVLELQRPALRLLRKIPRFGEALDSTYRQHGRAAALREIKAATNLSVEAIAQLEEISQFRVYSKNHLLFRAGEPIRSLFLLKSGWARFSPRIQSANISITEGETRNWGLRANDSYIGPSHCFGIEAITRDCEWEQTCTILGRAEVLEIPISKVRQYPELRETLLLAFSNLTLPQNLTQKRLPLPIAKSQEDLIETGLVDATNLLVMDMDLCVRCGNCSMACHQIHGQTRLLRRGIHITRPYAFKEKASFQSLLAPEVCLHCKDPECLTGCPTGSIGRFADGQVDIDPKTCIGCADCATQCPYNAITMVSRNGYEKGGASRWNKWNKWFKISLNPLPPAVKQTEDLLAVKCNLCANTALNPPGAKKQLYSCEENCPTGSLLRVDPKIYFAEVKNIEGVLFRDSSHVVVRHTSHKDAGKQLMHMIGISLTLVLTLLTILGIFTYGLETPLIFSWMDLRWITGIVGFTGIAGVMAYPVRRQMYKRRSGPLRYWLLSHSYLGIIGGITLLLHGGSSSGGVLTTALMISFDLVVLTGLFGIIVYYFAPRLMTKIEGQPLLIEDLLERREELSRELGQVIAASTPGVRKVIQTKVMPKIFSLGFLFRQYRRRETLEQMISETNGLFEKVISEISPYEKGNLFSAIEKAATIRRVDALIYLHQSLKLWLAPHVVFTSLMLALMIVHIIQVIYFVST
jgi:Fe-S-cluster-containing dehydrogenase component/CRP-like cAMP-binding protein